MKTLWVTFRIHKDANYNDRYGEVQEVILSHCHGIYWLDSTSYYMFQSESSAAQVARDVAAVLGAFDLALVGATEFKTAVFVGYSEDIASLRAIVPHLTEL